METTNEDKSDPLKMLQVEVVSLPGSSYRVHNLPVARWDEVE